MTLRPCQIVGNDCLIPLTQGKTATVDATDYGLVASRLWNARKDGNGYYAASKGRRDGKSYTLYLHRLLLGEPRSHVDHIDGNGLNNRRSNLRLCTPSQNQANRRRQFGSSMFRGVARSSGKWSALIKVRGQAMYLGRFGSELDAAFAYDKAAIDNFGEFARTNFPLQIAPVAHRRCFLSISNPPMRVSVGGGFLLSPPGALPGGVFQSAVTA